MFRRDKDSKMDNEGLRRMREAIRQRLDQPEPGTAPGDTPVEEGYRPLTPPGEGSYPYESLGGEGEYSFLPATPESRSDAPTEVGGLEAANQGWAETAPAGPAVTTIAPDTTWRGTLRSTADVRVDGALNGEIETEQELRITAAAKVDATIRARSIVVAGHLTGQVNCRERLEVLPGGRVSGQIDVGAFVIHEGAFLGGQVRMKGQGGGQSSTATGGEDDEARPMLQRVR